MLNALLRLNAQVEQLLEGQRQSREDDRFGLRRIEATFDRKFRKVVYLLGTLGGLPLALLIWEVIARV